MPEEVNRSPKRDAIVAVAADLFYAQGYGATGIKQIIDHAGIAKGTFYTHFSSKEELGLAWLRSRHAEWNGWFENAVRKGGDTREKIMAAFDFLAEWLARANYRGCAFLNTMAETPEVESPLRREVASHKSQLHSMFQRLATEHAGAERGRDVGTTLYLLFEGALVEAQNFRERWPVEAGRRAAGELLAST